MARHILLLIWIIGLAVSLSGCMEALQPVGANSPQTASGWPTSPPRASQPVALDEPAAPTIMAPSDSPTNGQLAPEPPTIVAATAVPVQAVEATVQTVEIRPTIAVPALPVRSNEELWRAQQLNRQVYPAPRQYRTSGAQLWWFDPVNQQHIVLGSFAGTFDAQAEFTLANKGLAALEVPYEVNRRYGLTALSPALLERIKAAGFSDWLETYVIIDTNIYPQ